MKVMMTRDSVHAGDDIDAPHSNEFSVENDIDTLLTKIQTLNYLPKISGGFVTWCLSSRIPIALYTQEWTSPKKIRPLYLELENLDFHEDILKLHFSYLGQIHADQAEALLERLQLTYID